LQLPLCIYEFFLCRDGINDETVTMVDLCAAIAR